MSDVRRAELLGARFDLVTMSEAIDRCLAWCAAPRAPHVVITANASHLCMMRRDPALREACDAAELVVADGMSVVWALRWCGERPPERVAGVDLMANLLAAAGARGLRVFFLGARPEVVAKLAADSAVRFPGLVIAGVRDGYFPRSEDEAVAEEVRRCAPHLLFVGMPSPFKETWVERFRERLQAPVMIGVGGSFDVLAGFVRRAPPWMQSAGLEWLWRLLMEPRKLWKRYAMTNGEFLWLAGRAALARRLGWRRADGGAR